MAKRASSAASPWRTRIVSTAEVDPSTLEASPYNWRQHPVLQKDAMAGTLRELGWIQQLVVNQRTNHLVDGHLRLALAIESHAPTVPVLYVDLSEEEERLALVTLDPLSAMAQADAEHLSALLHTVQSGDAAVQAMLAQLAEQEGIIPPDTPEEHWQGMPEFEQEDKLGVQQIIIHFDTHEDVAAFAALLEQSITPQTKSLWYPPRQRGNDAVMVVDDALA